jgi:hypothetical protein
MAQFAKVSTGMVQCEVAPGRVDARLCRCATPTDQEFERARDQLLGMVRIEVAPWSDVARKSR